VKKPGFNSKLRDPIVTVRGDRYILRRPSPAETLGGGVIVDDQPQGRHKRFDKKVLAKLQSLAEGSPADVLLETALAKGAATPDALIKWARLEASDAQAALNELFSEQKLLKLEENYLIAASQWANLQSRAMQMVQAYHEKFPLRSGIPREELKSRLKT